MTNYTYSNGKRKTAVARVRLYEKGTGKITINGKDIKDWIDFATQQQKILSPLEDTGNLDKFDITIVVKGGGPTSQTESIRHGIAKSLAKYDPTFRATLKKAGYLSRDSRMKERKKYGLKRARRSPQFSKR